MAVGVSKAGTFTTPPFMTVAQLIRNDVYVHAGDFEVLNVCEAKAIALTGFWRFFFGDFGVEIILCILYGILGVYGGRCAVVGSVTVIIYETTTAEH